MKAAAVALRGIVGSIVVNSTTSGVTQPEGKSQVHCLLGVGALHEKCNFLLPYL